MHAINKSLFVRWSQPCPEHTAICPIIAPTSKFISMKKFFLSIFAASVAFGSVAQEAADQPQGSWYLGSADATEVLSIFSDGVSLSPTIGYAVADNIVVSLSLASQSASFSVGAESTEFSYTSYGLSGAYFLGGNYFVGAGVQMSSGSLDADGLPAGTVNDDGNLVSDPQTSFGFGVNAGKYIPVRDMWYVAPQLSFGSAELDFGDDTTIGSSSLGMSISLGARF